MAALLLGAAGYGLAVLTSPHSDTAASPPPTTVPSKPKLPTMPTTPTTPTTPADPTTVPPAPRAVATVPRSIDPTGKTDVTAALNAFLASVPPDTTIQLAPGAVYRAEGTIVIRRKQGFGLRAGTGAIIEQSTTGASATPTPGRSLKWPRLRAAILVESSSQVWIEGLGIDGPNNPGGAGSYRASLEAQAGVDIQSSSAVYLSGLAVSHVFGDCVTVEDGSRDVSVTQMTCTSNGRQGVAITGASSVVVASSRFSKVARSAFDLEPNVPRARVYDVRIVDNTINAHLSFIAAQGTGPGVDGILVSGNTLLAMPMTIYVRAVDHSRRSDWTISNNTTSFVQGSPVAEMQFFYVDNIRITGNHMPMAPNRKSVAVYLVEPCGWTLAGNDFPGAEPTEPQGVPGTCPWTSS